MDTFHGVRRYPAELLDGVSAVARQVLVSVEQDRLEISAADGTQHWSWPLSSVAVDPLVIGAVHVRNREQPEVLLTSSDPALRAAIEALGRTRRPEQRAPRWVLGLGYAGATAAAVALIWTVLPVTSRALARQVPLEVEAQLGATTVNMIRRARCEDPKATAALGRLADRLRVEGDPAFAAARFEIVNLAMVNAFAFPGGNIVITRGLVEKAQSADEVAGVLAHELEHVAQRHVMAQVVRSAILTTGWQLTVGDFSGLMAVDPVTLMEIAALQFSRDDERDADAGAIRRLRQARISTTGFAAFFERMEKEAGGAVPEWLSTHPASALRGAAASAEASSESGGPAMSEEDWKALRHACPEEPTNLGMSDLFDV